MATHLILIRHATIDAQSRLHGVLDVPLSLEGLAEISHRLAQPPTASAPAALYTSPLRRASQTAAALARSWSLEAREAVWAREIDCGTCEGMRIDDLQRRFPWLWAQNAAQDDDDFTWPGGESYRVFRARVLAGFSALAVAHPDERVAVVTHAGVISQVLGAIAKRPAAVWADDRPDPFTATDVLWVGERPAAVIAFNRRDWY